MLKGKIMDQNHIIGKKAETFIRDKILPAEWVLRTMTPDYGIDFDIEIFEYNDKKCITLGEHLFLQLKGTENPQYGIFTIGERAVDVIKYQLEVSELNLVERMGSAFPVLLILVDLSKEKAYHICLNDYIKKILPIQKLTYKKQKTVVINIPVKNEVSAGQIDALKWYGKRTKIYSMFHEMLVDIEDFNYMDDEELLAYGKRFIEYYRNYDVLIYGKLWDGLKRIKDTLDNLHENNFVSNTSISLVQRNLGYTTNWEAGKILKDDLLTDEEIDAYSYAQKTSIRELGELIRNYSGIFEEYCREWFMPGVFLGV